MFPNKSSSISLSEFNQILNEIQKDDMEALLLHCFKSLDTEKFHFSTKTDVWSYGGYLK